MLWHHKASPESNNDEHVLPGDIAAGRHFYWPQEKEEDDDRCTCPWQIVTCADGVNSSTHALELQLDEDWHNMQPVGAGSHLG